MQQLKVDENGRFSKTKVTALVTALAPYILMALKRYGIEVPLELVVSFLVSAVSLLALFFRDAMDKNAERAEPKVYSGLPEPAPRSLAEDFRG